MVQFRPLQPSSHRLWNLDPTIKPAHPALGFPLMKLRPSSRRFRNLDSTVALYKYHPRSSVKVLPDKGRTPAETSKNKTSVFAVFTKVFPFFSVIPTASAPCHHARYLYMGGFITHREGLNGLIFYFDKKIYVLGAFLKWRRPQTACCQDFLLSSSEV